MNTAPAEMLLTGYHFSQVELAVCLGHAAPGVEVIVEVTALHERHDKEEFLLRLERVLEVDEERTPAAKEAQTRQ